MAKPYRLLRARMSPEAQRKAEAKAHAMTPRTLRWWCLAVLYGVTLAWVLVWLARHHV